MSTLLQVVTILVMLVFAFLTLNAFGPRRDRLLFTKEEKAEWDHMIGRRLGGWFTLSNIIGTLTSLATVYIFFIGSSKLFGYWIFLCSITIWLGAFITNFFTTRICSNSYIKELLADPSQTGGVIATLFWRNNPAARRAAALVKWISLINILSIIWLDFALFADISGALLHQQSIFFRIALLAVSCFAIFLFTFKYGLRGFVFADFFQSPLIFFGTIILLAGVAYLGVTAAHSSWSFGTFLAPMLSMRDCVLFAVQVLSLNLFIVLVAETHWMRIWIFRDREVRLQARSTFATAFLWALLSLIGLFAFQISNGAIGESAIIVLLSKLLKLSPVFLVAFWIAASAALFASADSQIYAFLLVRDFDLKTGRLRPTFLADLRPVRGSLLIAGAFSVVYYILRLYNIPFEKLIFTVLPVCLTLVPGFVLLASNFGRIFFTTLVCLVAYIACGAIGLLQPASNFAMTLITPTIPVAVSLGIFIYARVARRL